MQRHPGGAPPPPPPPPPQPGHGGVYAEAPRPKNDGIPYIGSRISLISKTDIRYEGFLFNIDTQQSMVALQHVRSFGTEGRRADAIPPSDQVLPYATFKASEIKDLHVSEAAPPPMYGYAQPPPPPPMPYHAHGVYAQPPLPPGPPAPQPPLPPSHPVQPPAPRQPPPPPSPPKKPASPPKQARPAPAGPTLLTPGAFANAPKPAAPQPVVQQAPPSPRRVEEAAPVHQAPRSSNDRNASAGSRTIPGMGDHLLKRKERRVPGGADGSVSTGQDFNFEQNLSGFDKEVEFSKLEISDNKAKGSYQKSSFFDTISCDALDRLEGKQTRITSGQERKLNSETFGAVGLNNNRRNFRGGRSGGGGNGGRGGGRRGGGRGRGNSSWDGRPRDHN